MNEKSKVKNLSDFPVSWKKMTLVGDEYLKANSSTFILNSEIETQVESGNKFFTGTDGLGSHAMVYIENEELREHFRFDCKEENRKQFILDDEKCKAILDYKMLATFKKHLEDDVVTISEKMKIMNYARKVKLNEHDRIKALEEHCKIKFES